MVVDTSILLSVYFDEEHGAWAAAQLKNHAGDLLMSTVNLTETLIRIRDQQPDDADEIEGTLLTSGIEFVPPTVQQAKVAANARIRLPLNLGDCFAYALALERECALLTLDRDFRAAKDILVILP